MVGKIGRASAEMLREFNDVLIYCLRSYPIGHDSNNGGDIISCSLPRTVDW